MRHLPNFTALREWLAAPERDHLSDHLKPVRAWADKMQDWAIATVEHAERMEEERDAAREEAEAVLELLKDVRRGIRSLEEVIETLEGGDLE